MSTSEISKILSVLDTADGGCSHCVDEIYGEFIRAFPELAVDVQYLRPGMAEVVREALETRLKNHRDAT